MIRLFLLIFIAQIFRCPAVHAQEAFPFVGVSTAAAVHVRAGENKAFESLTELQQGETVVVVGESYGWYKIRLPLKARCYVYGKYVEQLGGGIGRVTGDRVNIRARETVQSSVIGRLSKGTRVRILKESGDWVAIEPGDRCFGWVLSDYIVFKSKQIPPPRIVEPPVRNVYRKKRLMEVKEAHKAPAEIPAATPAPLRLPPPAPEKTGGAIVATGVLEGLGAHALTETIRYQLVVDGKPAYYLKGYRTVMDGFINYKVKIEGEVLPDIKAPHPVVLVTKLYLIL